MISTFDKCLFVHIPKVAGQSIESVFLARAGLSWNEREEMLLKHNKDPKLGPPRLAHLTAAEYIKLGYLSEAEFTKLRRVSFVRNPWERLVSEYVYRQYPYSFDHFLLKYFPTVDSDNFKIGKDLYRHVVPQAEFICDDADNLLVNFVGKFENLTEDFANITQAIVGQRLTLPHKNKSKTNVIKQLFSSSNSKHYSHFYNDETQKIVAKRYQRDIALFNYSFEQE